MSNDRRPCCGPTGLVAGATRREFLYVGLVGGLGLTLPEYLQRIARAADSAAGATALTDGAVPTAPKGATQVAPGAGGSAAADAVIHIFLPGGLAAQESFDPKPLAPIEYRGPLGVVPTCLPGVVFSECLTETAKIADRLTIIRSMNHGEAAHERGTHNMFTGYRPSPALTYPSMGSVVSHELGARSELPPYVVLPTLPTEFAGSGFLSARFGPFSIASDPADPNFAVRDLSMPADVDHERFARRQRLLAAVEAHFRSMEKCDAIDAMDQFYQRAYAMLSSAAAREAFNLKAEPDAVRDEYGRHAAGQRMLLCRRLVEAGVRFVSMTFGGWDHHANIADGVRSQLRPFDQGFAALVRDLERRGRLDRTLVMLTTEFGRTPKINRDGGRDHWPRVFSVALAGGGVQRGLVYGASDATGSSVDRDPIGVEDLAATVYHQLGISYERELIAPGNRPIEIVKDGKVVRALLARSA